MKQNDAIQRLTELDKQGRYVFLARDFRMIFLGDSARSVQATVHRLVASGILESPTKGVYIYALSKHQGLHTIEWIARALRRGHYNYVSLESALSRYGVISQIPVGRITVMTTGRKGVYETPYGTIEFTHTKKSVPNILSGTLDCGHPLRLATKLVAASDLRRVGRNLHLLDLEVLSETD